MTTTPILGITEVAPNQSQKETTINNAFRAVESAMAATLAVSFASATTVTLSATQFTRNFIFRAVGATANSILRVPALINGVASSRAFVVRNTSGFGITVVSSTAGGSSVVIPNNSSRLLDIDGNNNVIVAAEAATTVAFLGLVDTPLSYAGKTGQFVRVNGTEDGLEFAPAVNQLSGLSDVDLVTTPPADGQRLAFNEATGKWLPAAAIDTVHSFIELEDTPEDYVGHAGKVLKVSPLENGLEFADTDVAFTDLTDAPTDYTGSAGKSLRVNATEDGLEFADTTGGVDSFTDLTDTPPDYTGNAGKTLRVKATEDGVEFADAAQLAGVPYRFAIGFEEKPTADYVIARHVVCDNFTLAANMAGCVGSIETNPTGAYVISVLVKPPSGSFTAIGTITIGSDGVFTMATTDGLPVDLTIGSVIKVLAPTGVDATAAGMTFTFKSA